MKTMLVLLTLAGLLAGAGQSGPVVTLEESYPMDDPMMSPLEPGYFLITSDNGFEDGAEAWDQYSHYPISSEYDQIKCGSFAAEGLCYLWQCARDYCYSDTRQEVNVDGWTDIHVDFVYHVETQDPTEWADNSDVTIRTLQDGFIVLLRALSNQDHTYEWQYARYQIDLLGQWSDVALVFASATDEQNWTGFYYDGARMYGKPPHHAFAPVVFR